MARHCKVGNANGVRGAGCNPKKTGAPTKWIPDGQRFLRKSNTMPAWEIGAAGGEKVHGGW